LKYARCVNKHPATEEIALGRKPSFENEAYILEPKSVYIKEFKKLVMSFFMI